MDELKIRTTFMRTMISKFIAKMIFEKTGYKVDVKINDISVTVGETARIHIDADTEVDKNELKKVTKLIGIE